MKPKVYLSSSAVPTLKIGELVRFANAQCIPLEFSLTKHEEDVPSFLRQLTLPFLIHNYFPCPAEDFTINLSSRNSSIRQKSIRHCVQGIHLAEEFELPFYSIHAGFRIDISSARLGDILEAGDLLDREFALNQFTESIRNILEQTRHTGTGLLIENNVLTEKNLITFGENPFLMCQSQEFLALFREINDDRLGILMDLGHLKVSAQTLGFSRQEMLSICRPWIRGYHLNDNDGFWDTNEPLRQDTWFWPELHRNNAYYILEIKPLEPNHLTEQFAMVTERIPHS